MIVTEVEKVVDIKIVQPRAYNGLIANGTQIAHLWYNIIVEPFSLLDSIPNEVSVASVIGPDKNTCEPE